MIQEQISSVKANLKAICQSDPRTSGPRIKRLLAENGHPKINPYFVWGPRSNPNLKTLLLMLWAVNEITGNNYTIKNL